LEPHEAISVVRRLRHPDAVETEVQQRFVQAYARWIRRPQPASDG
jgi:protein-tyrosine phosphatase